MDIFRADQPTHPEDFDYRLFRYHYLLGADWRLCCQRLGLVRGNFFHHTYEIESRLGRVFAELTPYPLYPVAEYFGIPTRGVIPRAPPSPNRKCRTACRSAPTCGASPSAF